MVARKYPKPDPKNPDHVDVARASPLGWGWFVSGGLYLPYLHVKYLNRQIVEAVGHRLQPDHYDLLMEAHPRSGKSKLVSQYTPGWFIGDRPGRTAWYPTMRILRQQEEGVWKPLVDALRRELSLPSPP